MSESRIRVGVVYGGTSSEHSISCVSAGSVLRVLDPQRYEVLRVGIDRQGTWRLDDQDVDRLTLGHELPEVLRGPEVSLHLDSHRKGFILDGRLLPVDVVFPILHGPFGEDGTVQGLLEVAGIPYVGSGVLASALGMDKISFKSHMANAGIDVGRFVGFTADDWAGDPAAVRRAIDDLGYPVFVKPSRAGSSQGISKVHSAQHLSSAVEEALRHDPRLIVEAGLEGAREVEIGVLATPRPQTSVPGEVVVRSGHEFYDFEAKYLDDAAELVVPADLPADVEEEVRRLAVAAFEALDCEGLARVDFFVRPDGALVNEVNTMPGFTPISLFPRMCAARGIDYATVLDLLIADALRRGTGLR